MTLPSVLRRVTGAPLVATGLQADATFDGPMGVVTAAQLAAGYDPGFGHGFVLIARAPFAGEILVKSNTLDGWKAWFGSEVDAQHAALERRVVSEGQTIIDRYRRKQAEAPAARAKLALDLPLDVQETPLIAAAVQRIQAIDPTYDPLDKVEEIERNAAAWVPLDVAVEGERDGVKTLIRTATTLAEIEAAFATLSWPA